MDISNFTSFKPVVSIYNDYTNETYPESLFSSLIALLSTPKGTHPYDPEYGVNLRSYVLGNDTSDMTRIIEQDIRSSIQIYLPTLYPMINVVITKEQHPSGIGLVYKVNIIVEDTIVKFNVTKQGSLIYNGSTK